MLRITALACVLPLALVAGCGGSDAGGLGGGPGGAGGSGGVSGAGSSCAADEDCGGQKCELQSSRCVECLDAADCPPGMLCSQHACALPASCQSSLDCVGGENDRPICDPVSQLCVQCAQAADCPADNDCELNRCVPFSPCVTSLDCPTAQVCDSFAGRCVQCVETSDCGDEQVCVASKCRPTCDSDNDCTPLGMLCDRAQGYCVGCTGHAACREDQFCALGDCRADLCAAGYQRCQGNGISVCSTVGDAWSPSSPCGADTTCVQAGALAACEPWLCAPGTTQCDALGERLVECDSTGLNVLSETNCAGMGLVCSAGRCQDLVCAPSQVFCLGQELRQCSSDGLSSTLQQTCPGTQLCDALTRSCKVPVCQPNQPVCDGDRATVCDAVGSGPAPGGTNCASSGKSCLNGSCVSCVPRTEAAVAVPLDLHIMLDATVSMGTDCPIGGTVQSKWCGQINGVHAFLSDPANAGIGIGLNTWAEDVVCAGSTGPTIPYGILPGPVSAATTFLGDTQPSGASDVEPALQRLIRHTSTILDPGRNRVGVFFTDTDFPSSCETRATVINALLANHYTQAGVPTYVVGVGLNNDIKADQWAVNAGVSPHTNFCIQSAVPPCLRYQANSLVPGPFQDVLQEIVRVERLCELTYPSGSAESRVSLTYQDGAGATQTMAAVGSKAQCGAGLNYYLDSPSNPTRIDLCPKACDTVRLATQPSLKTVVSCD